MVNNHLSSCNLWLFLEINESINKACSRFLVMPTRQTINPMTLKFFLTLSFYWKSSLPDGKIINIEGMVSYYFSSCNSEQLKAS